MSGWGHKWGFEDSGNFFSGSRWWLHTCLSSLCEHSLSCILMIVHFLIGVLYFNKLYSKKTRSESALAPYLHFRQEKRIYGRGLRSGCSGFLSLFLETLCYLLSHNLHTINSPIFTRIL